MRVSNDVLKIAIECHQRAARETDKDLRKFWLDNAAEGFRAALAVDPNCMTALINLGGLEGERERFHSALAYSGRALALAPNEASRQSNYGNILWRMGRFDEANAYLEAGVRLGPNNTGCLHNLALERYSQGRPQEAVALFNRELEIHPDDPVIRHDRSYPMLATGDLQQGLLDHEARFEPQFDEEFNEPPRKCRAPRWKGEDLDGKTLMIHEEQGWGDTIMWGRFLPMFAGFKDYGCERIAVAIRQPLRELIAAQNYGADIISYEAFSPAQEFSYCAPLLSAVAALADRSWGGLKASHISPLTYIKAPLAGENDIQVEREQRDGICVGLVWASGHYQGRKGKQRKIPLGDLLRLYRPGLRLFSLQLGADMLDIGQLGAQGIVTDFAPYIASFADTARIIAALDAVVTVDTSVAHLAGAMGKPTFMMAPRQNLCWRWQLCDEYGRTRWYEKLEILQPRKTDDGWHNVIERIGFRLAAMAKRA